MSALSSEPFGRAQVKENSRTAAVGTKTPGAVLHRAEVAARPVCQGLGHALLSSPLLSKTLRSIPRCVSLERTGTPRELWAVQPPPSPPPILLLYLEGKGGFITKNCYSLCQYQRHTFLQKQSDGFVWFPFTALA